MPRLAQSACADQLPRLHEAVDVTAPRQGLVGDANAVRHRQRGELAQVARKLPGLARRVGRGRRAGEHHLAAERGTHLDHRTGDVDLVGVQAARQTFEVAQHLEAGGAQAARTHRAHRGVEAVGMADDIARAEHHLRRSRPRGSPAAWLRAGRPARWCPSRTRRSSWPVVVHQLEHDAAQQVARDGTGGGDAHRLALDEFDAALRAAPSLQPARRGCRCRRGGTVLPRRRPAWPDRARSAADGSATTQAPDCAAAFPWAGCRTGYRRAGVRSRAGGRRTRTSRRFGRVRCIAPGRTSADRRPTRAAGRRPGSARSRRCRSRTPGSGRRSRCARRPDRGCRVCSAPSPGHASVHPSRRARGRARRPGAHRARAGRPRGCAASARRWRRCRAAPRHAH